MNILRNIQRAAESPPGFALVVVLWMLTVLSFLAVSYSGAMRVETQVAANESASATARALAEAGIHFGILQLLAEDNPQERMADGRILAFPYAGTEIAVTLQDETGKVDLNAAPDTLITNLLVGAGLAEDDAKAQSARIIDWRDDNDERHPDGAEDSDYDNIGWPYPPKNAPFESIGELSRVLGMTPALAAILAPAVTVYSGVAGINPFVAPKLALLALPGMKAGDIDTMMDFRLGPPGEPPLPNILAGGEGILARFGPVYAVRGVATMPGGAVFAREAVVWITGDEEHPFWILAWRTPASGDTATEPTAAVNP